MVSGRVEPRCRAFWSPADGDSGRGVNVLFDGVCNSLSVKCDIDFGVVCVLLLALAMIVVTLR